MRCWVERERRRAGRPEPGARSPLRLGGMALRNGLLIHGPDPWAAAARTSDGAIEVASGPKPTFGQARLGKVPVLRGPLRLAEAMAVVPIAALRLRSARLPLEDPRVIAAALASAAAAIARRSGDAARRRPRARGGDRRCSGSVPALAALRDRDLAAYHGVEHKAIGAYERARTRTTSRRSTSAAART